MKQITVISGNRPGIIATITEALAGEGINIENIDAETFDDTAVTIVSVDQYDLALKVLQNIPDLKAITEDAIVIRIKDEPGALARIARRFSDAGINLRSLRFLQRDNDFGLVAISTERTQEAMALVQDVLVA